MKKSISVLLLLGTCGLAHGLEISELFDRAAQTVTKLVGLKDDSQESARLKLPEIPQIERSATSTKVYENKKLPIHQQGAKYLALNDREKLRYRIAFVEELYQVTRNAPAKESDLQKFVNVLEQGGSREGVYRAITLDQVYATLERYEEVPSKQLQDFALEYGRTYLNREFDQKALAQLNLWTIKRIIIDKTLEVMDALAMQAQDLNTWYAILSAQMAREHQGLWQNKVRSHQSELFHLDWAKKAPYEHIKSETIIKLHAVMNTLNG